MNEVLRFLGKLGTANLAFIWMPLLAAMLLGVESQPPAISNTDTWLVAGLYALASASFNFAVNLGVVKTYPLFAAIGTVLGIPLSLGVDCLLSTLGTASTSCAPLTRASTLGGAAAVVASVSILLLKGHQKAAQRERQLADLGVDDVPGNGASRRVAAPQGASIVSSLRPSDGVAASSLGSRSDLGTKGMLSVLSSPRKEGSARLRAGSGSSTGSNLSEQLLAERFLSAPEESASKDLEPAAGVPTRANNDIQRRARRLRIAFVGNSYIYYNDLPRLIEALAPSYLGGHVETASCLRGGATLPGLLRRGGKRELEGPDCFLSVRELFLGDSASADGESQYTGSSSPTWDFVVMNDYSQQAARAEDCDKSVSLLELLFCRLAVQALY